MKAPLPGNESVRLAALKGFQVLDTESEAAFDEITSFVSELFDVPICAISLIDESRQWFKSIVGLDATETSRDIAFCSHTILKPGEVFIVEDATQDGRFRGNPLVTGEPNIRFYAGAPLTTSNGLALGSLCVIDDKPRQLDETQRKILQKFASQVVTQLELRKAMASQQETLEMHAQSEERLARAQSVSGTGGWEYDLQTLAITWSLKTYEIFGIDPSRGVPSFDEILGLHHPDDQEVLLKAVNEAVEYGKAYKLDLRVRRGKGYIHTQANGEVVFDEFGNPSMLVGTIVDISARKFAELRLNQHAGRVEELLKTVQTEAARAEELAQMYEYSAKRFEAVFSGLPVACMGLDLDGKVMEWNFVSESTFGYSASEAVFQDPIELLVPEERREKERLEFEQALESGGSSATKEQILYAKDGTPVWVLSASLPMLGSKGELAGIVVTHVDISARKRAESELVQSKARILEQHNELQRTNEILSTLATTDGLTGLKNHRALQEYLDDWFKDGPQSSELTAVILIDVDHFKSYNDTFGHPAGDEVLRRVAKILRETVRHHDFTARYGGEEFAIVLNGPSIQAKVAIAEQVRANIESALWPNRGITISVGIACSGPELTTKVALIKAADEAMYDSKRGGRNKVTVYSPSTSSVAA